MERQKKKLKNIEEGSERGKEKNGKKGETLRQKQILLGGERKRKRDIRHTLHKGRLT
jgi:hypothetical protein